MPQARYSLTCDPKRDFIHLVVSGFFSVEEVDALHHELAGCYDRLRCPANQHVTLVDTLGMDIQAQEVVSAFMTLTGDPRYRSRRLAIIVKTSLSRLQAQRVAGRPEAALFHDAKAAERWLFDTAH